MLDAAAAAWPDLADDRKGLLLRLAETGAHHLPAGGGELEEELRRHVGEWVAVRGSCLLAADLEASVVVRWLHEHGERAEQMFRVPAGDAELPAEHGLA